MSTLVIHPPNDMHVRSIPLSLLGSMFLSTPVSKLINRGEDD